MDLESKNLLTELLEADSKYYSTGTSPLSDAQYDMKRAQFKKLEPNHPYNDSVGAKIPVDAKPVKHRIVAGSLEKLQDPTEISAWGSKKGRSGYRMDWKLDGYTLVLQYEDGVLKEAATRGDGVIGESVLWNAALMESVPKRLPVPFTGDVRGECVLNKVIFERVFKPLGYSNARNAVAVIRDQKGNGLAKYLSFVAFDLVTLGDEVFNSENEKRSFMAQMGFTVVPSILIDFNVRNIFETFDTFQANRIEYCYEVDGVVVRYESLAEQAEVGSTSDLRPKGQRCIKFANEEAKTVCTGYTLTLGSSGSIIPTLSFEPVEIGGAMVSSVLGCNFTLLKEKDIAIGDHVTLTRAGGVIPYIQRVDQRPTNRVLINPPKFCPICGYTTVWEGAHLKCGNEECEGKAFRLLQLWVQKREIKGLGETLLQTLYDEYEVMTPVDLYSLNYATLSQVMMSGRKVGTSASTILAEIEKSKECSLQDLVGSVGVKLLGRQEAENIMNRLGVTTLEGFFTLKMSDLLSVEGYKETKAQAIVSGLKKAQGLIEDLLKVGVKIKAPEKIEVVTNTGSGALSSQVVVFTGAINRCDAAGKRFTRKMMQDLAKKAGAEISDDVKTGVTMLVTADPDSTSGKMGKARKLGIKVVGEEGFFTLIGM